MSNENLTNPTTEEMAREVYEYFGVTWHKWIRCDHRGNHVDMGFGNCHICSCGHQENINTPVPPDKPCTPNPPLATSIDAWHEHIFPVMSDEQKREHAHALYHMDECEGMYTWEATPMHHLEAAYNVVKGE